MYPPRDACSVCLSYDLAFVDAPKDGILLSQTTVRASAEPYFRERAPWCIGLVRLGCGPIMVTHLHADCREGEAVCMSLQVDKAGQAVAFAAPAAGIPNPNDRQWREMTADPRGRCVLVTDGRSAVGQETALAMIAAGAATVYVGMAERSNPLAGEARLVGTPGVEIVPLDVGEENSVGDLAAAIAGKVDILANTAEHVRPGGLLSRQGITVYHEEIAQSYIGFVRLAQVFGRELRRRGGDGASAWVNVLSVYALANWCPFGAYSASQAAVLSLSHCLRAELRSGGIRVINVFTGPLDTECFHALPPPKVPPRAVAAAITTALKVGTEDVFVGDVAESIRRRLAANPKAVERELGG